MENGTAVHISIMGYHWDHQITMNARLIPSLKAGQYFQEPVALERSRIAMESVNKRLVRPEYSLVQLLDPPFDKSDLNPGYIKGYVPGVRENGGQYTHAAIWAAMAFSKLGDSKKAWEILRTDQPDLSCQSPEEVARYKVEPYVIAADVYALSPHIGRGGWTWYTGSAGWMYRLIVESLLGLRLETDKLYFEPCLPSDWVSYKINYRFRETIYRITIIQLFEGIFKTHIIIDGTECQDMFISLVNDRQEHQAEVKIYMGNHITHSNYVIIMSDISRIFTGDLLMKLKSPAGNLKKYYL